MFILNFYRILTAYQLLTAVKLSQKVNFGSLRKGYKCKFTASHCPPTPLSPHWHKYDYNNYNNYSLTNDVTSDITCLVQQSIM